MFFNGKLCLWQHSATWISCFVSFSFDEFIGYDHVFTDDTCFIAGHSWQPGETLVLDNSSPNYLVLFPDTLVSGTTISMGITCPRRAVLSELFKTDGPNEVMFLGTFLHELFDFFIQGKGKYVFHSYT